MPTNIPGQKSEIIEGVTQGKPVTNKQTGERAKNHLEKQLSKAYGYVVKAKEALTKSAMLGNPGPDSNFMKQEIKALGKVLNRFAEIVNTSKLETKAQKQKTPAQAKSSAPEQTVRRPRG